MSAESLIDPVEVAERPYVFETHFLVSVKKIFILLHFLFGYIVTCLLSRTNRIFQ